jgi:hypothetical protein
MSTSENKAPLMPEDVEKGTIEETPPSLGFVPMLGSPSSSVSSLLEVRSGSVRSEELNALQGSRGVPSPPPPSSNGVHEDDGFDKNKREGVTSRRSASGLHWHQAGATANAFPDTLIDNQDKVPSEKLENLPRLVDRNRAFHQSSNKVHLRHNQGLKIYRLLRFNWFHVLLRWPTRYSFSVLMSVWTGVILMFAGIYVWHDQVNRGGICVLGGINGETISWGGAFAFSLQTCSSGGTCGTGNQISSHVPHFPTLGCLTVRVVAIRRIYATELHQFFL